MRWFCSALRAGEHRVVVGHHDAPGLGVGEQLAVDPADAGDHAVGRGALRSARRACGAGAGPRPRAGRTRRTCPRRTGRRRSRGRCAGCVAASPGDRVGPRRVERHRLAVEHLGEVGADRVEVDGLGRRRRRSRRPPSGSTTTSGWPSNTVSPGATVTERTTPLHRRRDDVLHLHRLHDQQRLADAHLVARDDADARRSCPGSARAPRCRRRRARERSRGADDRLAVTSTASGSLESTTAPARRVVSVAPSGSRHGAAAVARRRARRRCGPRSRSWRARRARPGGPRIACRKGTLVSTPSTRSSRSARAVRSSASPTSSVAACPITLASSESKLGFVW